MYHSNANGRAIQKLFKDMFSGEKFSRFQVVMNTRSMVGPSGEYALAFECNADEYRGSVYPFVVLFSHAMTLVAFSLPKETAQETFGRINDYTTGVLWITTYFPQKKSNTAHNCWHVKSDDNSNDAYRFQLQPVILHRGDLHVIRMDVKFGMDMPKHAYKCIARGRILRDEPFISFNLEYPQRTYFSALYFESRGE